MKSRFRNGEMKEINEAHIGQMIEVKDTGEKWRGVEREFVGKYGNQIVCRDPLNNGEIFSWDLWRPIQTEAEKFLEKWKGQKITAANIWESDRFFIPKSISADRKKVIGFTNMGKADYIDVFDFDCTLWGESKPKFIPWTGETFPDCAFKIHGAYYKATSWNKSYVYCMDNSGKEEVNSFAWLLENSTQRDGSPCGVEVSK